ncbi:MAG: hypothetical protein JGK17_24215 [Microcoleus sp. PH2017_10_PVI_O_A]|uniref:hypothetical protein n=1 Tax=unclassified Microcoleus TaxID=2642155 RepID=UPI001D1ABAF1|nr:MULTISPECIES: hypothetical protein [unclassified Microcoleus]TAE76870.1 MAG: hypothetical protein EAZ83_27515 [Oscillatoriales cyanobacterium]MCC3408627.1 hypothetical protein [Microcoleus sp. PH2017_10_PVI_O_A]MCC3462714.1 hypothetical protein [Microcoleus sp. PH2017_11_PCY_U_A]MCC3481165.1 hypothetical protein [Microcoleus sp. PH2017_12_PCY_D_A]MCC3531217.1 hypothetical protein [Microcoleus sp. PH2017_21_RUC_O_A]
MSDEQEKNQILTQQPETISTASEEFANTAITSDGATSAPAETPAEIVAPEDISPTIEETETIPIPADNAPETSQIVGYSQPTSYTANPDRKPTPIWQILAVFLSGMLVGSVLSLGSLIAWRMYQERANLQIKLHSDVPLPESPPPVPTARAYRQPGVPPAPQQTLPATIAPSPTPTQIPSLSGVPQLASPSPSPSPAVVETPVTERVNFQAGATGTTLSNSLRANISKRYLLECNSGQSMTVKVQEGQVSADIIAPNGEKVGTVDSTGQWQGQLASSGDYIIEISGDRQANYGVKIEVK